MEYKLARKHDVKENYVLMDFKSPDNQNNCFKEIQKGTKEQK